MSDEQIYNWKEIEAESRAGMVCPDCFESELEEYPAFARDYDSRRKKIIHGTRCPNCDKRVDPQKVRTMLKSRSFGIGSLSISFGALRSLISRSYVKYAAGFLAAVMVLFFIPAIGMAALDGGGPQFDQGSNDVIHTDGDWEIRETENGYIITNGQVLICHGGIRDSIDDGDCAYTDSETAKARLEAFLADERWLFNGTAPNVSTSGERLSTINYLHGSIVDQDEEPYSGGTIVFADTGRTVEADEDGEYELDEHLDPGTYEIYAYTADASTVPFEIEVGENGRVSVVGTPDSALYVANNDGTVAQNRLNFVATSKYNIGASGGVDVDIS
jgi:hypothetical protein